MPALVAIFFEVAGDVIADRLNLDPACLAAQEGA